KHAGNQPARVAQLNHGNDRAILVQGDEGSAQVVWLGHRGTPSRKYSDEVAISSAARPIASFSSAMPRHPPAAWPASFGGDRRRLEPPQELYRFTAADAVRMISPRRGWLRPQLRASFETTVYHA